MIEFLKRKNIEISCKKYFIDAMGSMALGLFASLLIGTIFGTIGSEFGFSWMLDLKTYASSATGPAMAMAIAYSLSSPPLVMFSCATVGIAGNALGGPLGTLIATIVACEFGKAISKETKVDIIVTPSVTIIIGVLVAELIGPAVSSIISGFGQIVNVATDMQPLLMGILVSIVVGITLTLPISSAALCIMLGLSGLAGGAAVAGCCSQMVGFAVASFKENKIGGLVAQGLGTSMLQLPNIFKKPSIWITPILTSAITGPLATLVFKLEISSDMSVSAGMGTCGFVGPIGLISSMGNNLNTWSGIIFCCILIPAFLAFSFDKIFRKIGLVNDGDQKLDL